MTAASIIPSPQHGPAAIMEMWPFYIYIYIFFPRHQTECHKKSIKTLQKNIFASHCNGKTEGFSRQPLQLQASSLPLNQAADPEMCRGQLFPSPQHFVLRPWLSPTPAQASPCPGAPVPMVGSSLGRAELEVGLAVSTTDPPCPAQLCRT